jgi:hypothetical protein
VSNPRVVIGGNVYALIKPNVDPSRKDLTYPEKTRMPQRMRIKQIDRPWVIGVWSSIKRLHSYLNLILNDEVTEDDLIREVEKSRDLLTAKLEELPVKDPG